MSLKGLPKVGADVVHGHVEAGFEQVREAFAAGQRGDEGDAQLAVYQDGRPVVDLWTERMTGESLTITMSVTKGVTATCAHLLAQRGELDLDAPAVHYWPEFGAHGKDRLLVADLLAHRAGLSGFDPDAGITSADLVDWDRCTASLAATRPFWELGTAWEYHAITFGYLVGEVIRRATGRSVGRVLAEEIAGPLGLDLWIGLPESEESRVLPQFSHRPAARADQLIAHLEAMGVDPRDRLVRATIEAGFSVAQSVQDLNRREAHAAEIPAVNAIATARSLARMYAAVIGEVDGLRLLTDATVARASAPQTDHLPEPAALRPLAGPEASRFGLGYELPRNGVPMLGAGSFGHAGAGGRLAYAQPRTGTAVAYLCTQMSWDPAQGPDPRWLPWTTALHDALGLPLTISPRSR